MRTVIVIDIDDDCDNGHEAYRQKDYHLVCMALTEGPPSVFHPVGVIM